jgi:hypothetical protein
MSSPQINTWVHTNRYSADEACQHCAGIISHEPWCITRSPIILYIFQAVLDADKLSMGDHITMHALGVAWTGKICKGMCKPDLAADS